MNDLILPTCELNISMLLLTLIMYLVMKIDQFKQCPQCGTIVPIYEVKHESIKHESKIQPLPEPVKNPFDIGTEILGTDSRATQRRKNRGKPRSKRFRQTELIDKDIASEKGIVNIIYESGS